MLTVAIPAYGDIPDPPPPTDPPPTEPPPTDPPPPEPPPSTQETPTPELPFVDVPKDAVAYEAILWAYLEGLVTGVDGMFLPNNPMTRAQYALVLHRYEGEPYAGAGGMFSDMAPERPSYNAVTWANNNGIVTGYHGSFLPDHNMTRAQMILMMHRYSSLKGLDTSSDRAVLSAFSDVSDINPVGLDAMSWGVANNLITGRDGRLLPNDTVTRAQVVLILYRFSLGVGQGIDITDMVP